VISPSVVNLENLIHLCERELSWLDMAINYKKSCLTCLYGLDVSCANITSLNGHVLPWINVIRYLGIHIVPGADVGFVGFGRPPSRVQKNFMFTLYHLS